MPITEKIDIKGIIGDKGFSVTGEYDPNETDHGQLTLLIVHALTRSKSAKIILHGGINLRDFAVSIHPPSNSEEAQQDHRLAQRIWSSIRARFQLSEFLGQHEKFGYKGRFSPLLIPLRRFSRAAANSSTLKILHVRGASHA